MEFCVVVPMEIPLELIGIIAAVPASGMVLSMAFGSCFLTNPLYGEELRERSRSQGRLAVTLISGMGMWQYLTYMMHMWPLVDHSDVPIAVFYHALFALWILSYASAAKAQPQAHPVSAATDAEECPKCHRPKPEGTHHCSQCGVCVPGLDHHCLFINNCVGAANRKAFLLLTTYTLLVAAFLLVHGWPLFLVCLSTYGWAWSDFNFVIGYLVTAIVVVLVGLVWAVQTLTIPLGMTTIDAFAWFPCTRRQGKEYRRKPTTFMQKFANVVEVMGPPYLWWFPL
jgi:hypothetical protein